MIPSPCTFRAMNMLYEGLKQNSTIVIVPSTAVELDATRRSSRTYGAHYGTGPRRRKSRQARDAARSIVRTEARLNWPSVCAMTRSMT